MSVVYHWNASEFEVFLLEFPVLSFFGRESTPVETAQTFCHVADYVGIWLNYGKGAQACGNDFGIWVSTFVVISDHALSVPDYLPSLAFGMDESLWPEPPTRMYEHGCRSCEQVLDPQHFKVMAADPEYLHRIAKRTEEDE